MNISRMMLTDMCTNDMKQGMASSRLALTSSLRIHPILPSGFCTMFGLEQTRNQTQ